MLSSHQIAAMAQQQQAMFGNMANYAQQITPPGAMFGGYSPGAPPGPPQSSGGYGGYRAMAPQGGIMNMMAQMPYQMPGQFLNQGLGEQIAGGIVGAGSGLLSGASGLFGGVTGAAGLAALGFGGAGAIGGMMSGAGAMAGGAAGLATLGSLPMGGAVLAAGGLGMLPIGAGLAGAAYAGDQVYQGVRERQDVGRVMRQRFGGAMGVGGGRGGMGFSSQDVGQMSTMMRGMAADDMFTSFDELTRTLDKTSQMGLYRGVQSASEFREKFKSLVSTLKEVAKTMHTSLDEAAGFMEQQRNQGFFSGQDINRSLMRTRMLAGASGMSTDQMTQIGAMGTAMGRSMGMLGSTGSTAMKEMAANMGVAMQMGFISDQDIAEATGGLTGAEGAQAYAAQQMQSNRRWLKKGPGHVMLAGLWNKKGGIDERLMQRALAGDISIGELQAQGRQNIAATGGRQSEFFLDEDRLGGELMAQGGSSLELGVVGEHMSRKKGIELEDPIMTRWLMRYKNMSRAQVELAVKEYRKMPEIIQARNVKMAQQGEMEARTQAREVSGLSGLSLRFGQLWDKEVTAPLRQVGDDITGFIIKGIDDIMDEMEGTITTTMTERAKAAQIELRSTGKGGLLGRTLAQDRTAMAALQRKYGGTQTEGGLVAGLGRMLGTRGPSLDDRLRGVGAESVWTRPGATEQEKIGYLERDAASFARAQQALNLSETEQSELSSSVAATLSRGELAGKVDVAALGGLFGPASAASNYASVQKDIAYLEEQDPGFRARARGKTRHEKIALYQEVTKGLAGSKLGRAGYGEGGAGIADLRSKLDILRQERGEHTAMAQKYFRGVGLAAGIVTERTSHMRGGRFGGVTFTPGESIDVGALMTVAKGNKTLSGFLSVLADPNATEEDRQSASTGLRDIGLGRDKDILGVSVSDDVERTARAISVAADTDREGTEKALGNIFAMDSIQATILIDEQRRKQAEKLSTYVRTQSSQLNKIKDRAAVDAFRELVSASADPNNKKDLNKLEDEFLMKYASGEAGADIMNTLRNDPSGVYLAGSMRRMQDWVSKGGGKKAMREGEGERGRVKAVLVEELGGAGLGLSALGKSKQVQNQWINKIKSGRVSAEDIMKQLTKVAGDEGLKLRKGVTTADLEERLGGFVGEIQSDNKFSVGEWMQRGSDKAQREAATESSRGGDKTMEDLPALAQKQVEHLGNMVKLTQTIALKSGNADVVAAVEKLKINTKGEPGQ